MVLHLRYIKPQLVGLLQLRGQEYGLAQQLVQAIHDLVVPSHPLSFLAFYCSVGGFPFNPLKVKLSAGHLRTAQAWGI